MYIELRGRLIDQQQIGARRHATRQHEPLSLSSGQLPVFAGRALRQTELGKQLAKQITPAISQDDEALAAQDASTQSLIKFYRANRKF